MKREDISAIEKIRFLSNPPSAESLRLLHVGRDHLREFCPPEAVAACVCSSVAWGIATPVSDLDLGIIVRDGANPRAEKRLIGTDYVDHCQWPCRWLDEAVLDPLGNPILSYSMAFALVLWDPERQFAEAQNRLIPQIAGTGARLWIDHYVGLARDMLTRAREVIGDSPEADIRSFLFEGVRRTADALLHLVPGGHCGEWPRRLRQLAQEWGEAWLLAEAVAIIAPLGLDSTLLDALVPAVRDMHDLTATPPCGVSVGCSRESAAFFARKSAYYLQERDALSALQVLRKQLGYIQESLDAKQGEAESAQLAEEQRRLHEMLAAAWPYTPKSGQCAVDLASRYLERATRLVGGRVPPSPPF